MIHKIYILQWMTLIAGIISILMCFYSIFRGNKRDKIISFLLFFFSSVGYLITELRISNHNAKASIYLGVHELRNYHNSSHFKLEILPENKYLIYNEKDTVNKGKWDLSVSNDNSTLLLLDGEIFGIGELEVNSTNNK